MYKSLFIFFIMCVISFHVHSEPVKTVNVLTWWGYLDENNAAELVLKKCRVKLTHDNYTSNDEMLRRWSTQSRQYDLLIFSDTIFNVLKNQISFKKSKLFVNSAQYNSIIKKKYQENRYPPNVVYFSHALTGFIWNPDIIDLTENDTVQSVFEKAKKNKIILIDDPFEINMLLLVDANRELKLARDFISITNIKNLIKDSHVFISNQINKIYSNKDFAFSYQWSANAFSKKLPNKNYHFLINKNLSYISTDLLAQITDSKEAACVAGVLTGKEFMSVMQNKSRYFSPYGEITTVAEGPFKELYDQFLKQLPKLRWLERLEANDLMRIHQKWDLVKFELSKDNE